MKLSKEEKVSRKAWSKVIQSELRSKIKGTKWKVNGVTLFCVNLGYFFDSLFNAHIINSKVTIRLFCKPMELDPIYWSIFDMKENLRKPISFRGRAWFRCHGILLHEETLEFSYEQPPGEVVETVLRVLNKHVEGYLDNFSTVPFYEQLLALNGDYYTDLICSYLMVEDRQAAQEVLDKAIIARFTSEQPPVIQSKDFFDYAKDWLSN